ncbi:MAG: hypothetical protein KJO56_06885 [Gammaproteobacteria bacterium]|nr:hypothetical protein [Gammaproteobacteria bacterium]MBT8105363.1 hypothetical protein [Gammaproteobacteria bacterium]NNF48563.1 hypothetical protein [Woeseiaceae bacterium]NNK25377.1 hypothetical protein [Woeseiaceae bacterium]NNL63774.1 hypothetical protein [Woeseiaceae bacterium]
MASPANAVLALGATSLLPIMQPVSGVFLATIGIARGIRAAGVYVLLAAGTVLAFTAVLGASPVAVLKMLAAGWIPVYLLIVMWQVTGSALLALQLSLIVAAGVMLVFNLAVGDLDAYWQPMLQAMDESYRQAGMQSPLAALQAQLEGVPDTIGALMTMGVITIVWLLSALEFVLGGALRDKLPGEKSRFFRVRDLDFGRTLALAFVAVTVLAWLADLSMLRQVGFLFLTAFMLQGFAVVHWLHAREYAPVMVVFLAYGSLLVLQGFAVMAIAVVGLMDAMVRLRRRLLEAKGSRQ